MRRMLEKLLNLFARTPEKVGAAALPPIPPPKVPNKVQSVQSFSKRTATTIGEQRLMAADRRTANLDLLTLRNGTTTKSTIHDLALVSPDLSSAVSSYIRLVVTKEFSAVARNLDGTVNPDATRLVQQLITQFNCMQDYTQGFCPISGIHAVAEQLTQELRWYGACAMELVLDKARLPNRLQPISVQQIEYYDDGSGYIYPAQRINGMLIPLDYPSVLIESQDQDLLDAYSTPPMEAALSATLAEAEFNQDVRRVIKRALHPRLTVSIDSEKFRQSIPLDILSDPEKMALYQENYIAAVEATVSGLEPDDALVSFDSLTWAYMSNGNSTLDREYQVLQDMIDSKVATGVKAPPSVLGHGSGSSNIASAEIQLFLKSAEGVQIKINSILSRAFTLAARLMGQDVTVEFQFATPDLRPRSELAAFRAMDQSRILQQLSIGMISDEEACIALTGKLPPSGAPKLSGTFFLPGANDPTAVDTASAQSSTGALQQGLTSDAPTAPKGPAQKAPLERVK